LSPGRHDALGERTLIGFARLRTAAAMTARSTEYGRPPFAGFLRTSAFVASLVTPAIAMVLPFR
jgi:hypothetical protein